VNPYGLPHPDLRPHQGETIESLLATAARATVVNAPTGSGKTSFAAGVASRNRVISLVKTKNLQSENYGGSYHFDVLYGRTNYECLDPDAGRHATAAECLYPGAMNDCAFAADCPYRRAKFRASRTQKASLNYSYWLAARWPAEGLAADRGYLFCDEAHQLSDVTLDHASSTVDEGDRVEWGLPEFPVVRGKASASDVADCSTWLNLSAGVLFREAERMRPQGGGRSRDVDDDRDYGDKVDALSEATVRRLRRCEALLGKLEATHKALRTNEADWFIRSGPQALERERGREPGFVVRPLTARHHFPRYFLSNAWRTVMMSATIGDPTTFGEELGLGKLGEAWQYSDIPNAWEPRARPVIILDAPALSYANRANENVLNKHATAIAKAVLGCPSDWSGFIHVTSKSMAMTLAQRLAKHGIPPVRLWVPDPVSGTEQRARNWDLQKKRVPGSLAVTWSAWEGVDGLDEKICIVAKTPFPSLGDEYERERMAYSDSMYLQRTAWQMEQGLGRTRRGRAIDYDEPGERRGLVAIADGNFSKVYRHLSAGLRAAMFVQSVAK
jgi:Rad3-related DNA helicase